MNLIDVAKLSKPQLEALIENHRKRNATHSETYLSALAEYERRVGGGLDFEKSKAAVLRAAKEKKFISYGQLAEESGAPWSAAHYKIGGHIYALVEYAHLKGWPLLSAIIVDKAGLPEGKHSESSRAGLIKAAMSLGYDIEDEVAFIKEQQQLIFDWAQTIEPCGEA